MVLDFELVEAGFDCHHESGVQGRIVSIVFFERVLLVFVCVMWGIVLLCA